MHVLITLHVCERVPSLVEAQPVFSDASQGALYLCGNIRFSPTQVAGVKDCSEDKLVAA